MSGLRRIFSTNRIWSSGVYAEKSDFSFADRPAASIFVLDTRNPRKGLGHVHTYADPFLFAYGDELYLFVERQAVGEAGSIWAYKTSDLTTFEIVGEVLREEHHLSYPFVFSDDNVIYLVPESAAAHRVNLYIFDEFPHRPRELRILLHGTFFDSSLIKHGGLWYLFTTSLTGLEIFFTDDLISGDLASHPSNPITTSARFRRCGGGPVLLNGQFYRIAQDGSKGYGTNIHILRINELSPDAYSEELYVENYLRPDQTWNSLGGHHLSFEDFRGKRIIAVDGTQKDLFRNKIAALLERF